MEAISFVEIKSQKRVEYSYELLEELFRSMTGRQILSKTSMENISKLLMYHFSINGVNHLDKTLTTAKMMLESNDGSKLQKYLMDLNFTNRSLIDCFRKIEPTVSLRGISKYISRTLMKENILADFAQFERI